MQDIRAAVVGAGYLGRFHAQKYASEAGCRLVAVADPRPEAREALALELGTTAVADHRELLGKVDAVSVVTTTPAHFAIARDFLEAGAHVLVEKPITETVEQARELITIATRCGRILQVGHLERFNPAIVAAESELVGARFIDCQRLAPFKERGTDVNVVLDLMIHDIDIVQSIVGRPIESIDAVGTPVFSGAVDIANARLRFEGGCVANVTASRISQNKVRKIRVFQENAYLSLDYQNQSGYLLRLAREDERESSFLGKIAGLAADGPIVTDFSGRRIVREPVEVEKGEPLKIEIESFLHCAREGAKPKVSGYAAADALDIALDITRRIEEADPRKKPEPTI